MEGEIKEIEATDWSTLLNHQRKPFMIMFYNPTCPHCKIMDPSFTKHAEKFKDQVTFMKFNIQQNQQIPYFYGIQSTPTFIFFCQSQPITMLTGAVHPTILDHAIEDGLLHGKHCATNRTPIDYEFSGYV
jgi:thioredoxin 1